MPDDVSCATVLNLQRRIEAIEGCIDRLCAMVQTTAEDAGAVRAALREMARALGEDIPKSTDVNDERAINKKMDEIDKMYSRTHPWHRLPEKKSPIKI